MKKDCLPFTSKSSDVVADVEKRDTCRIDKITCNVYTNYTNTQLFEIKLCLEAKYR